MTRRSSRWKASGGGGNWPDATALRFSAFPEPNLGPARTAMLRAAAESAGFACADRATPTGGGCEVPCRTTADWPLPVSVTGHIAPLRMPADPDPRSGAETALPEIDVAAKPSLQWKRSPPLKYR